MGGGEREGMYVCIELIDFIMQQKLTQLYKAIILQAFFFLMNKMENTNLGSRCYYQ